ncbi:hypothetical protein HSR122_2664 [Halapricum desulfuricans]|uniref:Uncharacterized protein n=1 Tax=Halapricum desulfuricans TaxID=2841257 RepID=A0A897NC47_9EURY|nr:hypothetical protein HSR122_2664 [Halapricum desulfuricans]
MGRHLRMTAGPERLTAGSYWWLSVRNDIWHAVVPDQFEMG